MSHKGFGGRVTAGGASTPFFHVASPVVQWEPFDYVPPGWPRPESEDEWRVASDYWKERDEQEHAATCERIAHARRLIAERLGGQTGTEFFG